MNVAQSNRRLLALANTRDPVEVGHVCRSYDSCLVCTVHAHDAKTGEELANSGLLNFPYALEHALSSRCLTNAMLSDKFGFYLRCCWLSIIWQNLSLIFDQRVFKLS